MKFVSVPASHAAVNSRNRSVQARPFRHLFSSASRWVFKRRFSSLAASCSLCLAWAKAQASSPDMVPNTGWGFSSGTAALARSHSKYASP